MEPSNRYAWYVVALLTLANISSFLDRQILSLLVQPIKRDLHLSDSKMGLLMGLSFALFYTIFGIFIGRLADNTNRRNIIIGGVTIWSLMTALCAGVVNYSQFFLARMGVGVGEATLSPSAYSMIADYFPKEKLSRAMSIFTLGIFIGSGVAMLIGSGLVAHLPKEGMIIVPLFGEIFPWQILFIYIGFPGLIIALLLFTIKEPVRQGLLQTAKNNKVGFSDAFRIIFKNSAAFLCISFGTAFIAFVTYGTSAWVPTMIVRTFGWTPPQAGVFFGIVIVISSILGSIWGGWYADKLVNKGVRDGRLRVSVISGIGFLLTCFVPLLARPEWVLIGFAIPSFFSAANIGTAASAVQTIMPNQVRSLASSIFLFIVNFFGLGLGPSFVAIMNDFVFHDESMIRYSVAALILIGGVMVTLFFSFGLKPYRKAVEG